MGTETAAVVEMIVAGLWFTAFMLVTYSIGIYLAGAVEFKSWRWPWRS
jgi:hypothetical protein